MPHVAELQFAGSVLSRRGRLWDGGALTRIGERIARRLRREGVEPGSRVAIAVGEPALFLAAAGAARSLGAVAVLLSSRAARAVGRDAHLVADPLFDAQPRAVVLDVPHRDALAGVLGRCPAALLVHDDDELAACEPAPITGELPPSPPGAALLVHTSGSELRPKGVIVGAPALRF